MVLIVIGVLICLILHTQLHTFSSKFVLCQENWPLYIQFLMVTLIAGVLWFFLINLGGFNVKHLCGGRLIRYPPTWLAGVTGAFIYLLITQDNTESVGRIGLKDFLLLICWSPILLGVIIATVLSILFGHQRRRFSNKPNDSVHHQSSETLIDDPHQLYLWIEDESPIYFPFHDLFGLARISRRIANILLKKYTRTVGIVGTYGSGKTSLLNIVESVVSQRFV